MAIERKKIRAKVSIGVIAVETPYILSFNVRKSRGQPSTFDCSLKVKSNTGANLIGDSIKISAGVDNASDTIFTGIIRKVTISPCFDDPEYVIMNLSGADVLSLLQGKKFTRRCIGQKTSWVSINSVSRKGLKSGKFKYVKEPVLIVTESDLAEAANVLKASSPTAKNVMDGASKPDTGKSKEAKIVATPQLPVEE